MLKDKSDIRLCKQVLFSKNPEWFLDNYSMEDFDKDILCYISDKKLYTKILIKLILEAKCKLLKRDIAQAFPEDIKQCEILYNYSKNNKFVKLINRNYHKLRHIIPMQSDVVLEIIDYLLLQKD